MDGADAAKAARGKRISYRVLADQGMAAVWPFVAEFAPVAVCKWNLHLCEKNLFQCCAKIFRHIGCACQLI